MKKYETTQGVRIANRIARWLISAGIGPANGYLLGVRGRKTGKLYTTPVALVIEGQDRYLVSPYGEVNWVRNARAAGAVSLMRAGKTETVTIQELDAAQSAPILKLYAQHNAVTRPYFDAAPDAPVEAFAAEAAQHPVFRLGATSAA
ncbi:MAG: nitroreductase family deazaflavin-dependent oxidoreductase [Anaerolineae bacterium]|nr:nitroreductase family deazaflavin-dependent oxidoreductase [Anaerolineae bacterium]